MAQDRLVNYRHLQSKRGMCCQVLRHEVGLSLRGGKAGRDLELHEQMLCHVLRLRLFSLFMLGEQLRNWNPCSVS